MASRFHTKPLDVAPKVFVGNLPFLDTREEDVTAHFERAGRVLKVEMPRDPTGGSGRIKGYAFVTFEDFDAMHDAIDKVCAAGWLLD